VTALAGGGDALLVADDPAAAAGGIGVAGGRLWSVPTAALGRPRTNIDLAPATITRGTTATFAFSARSAGVFECRFDGPNWDPCGGPGTGTRTYGGLAEGIHVFDVRAVDRDPAIGTGDPTRRTFVVDRTPPSVTIDGTYGTFKVGVPLEIAFSSSEPNVAYACSIDGAPPAACKPPLVLGAPAVGSHRVTVTAVDLAGNSSDPSDPAATVTFSVVAPPPPPSAVPSDPAPVADVAPVGAPAPAPTSDETRPRCAPLPSATTGFLSASTRASGRRLQLAGWALETPCAGAVRVAIAQVRSGSPPATACRFLSRNGLLGRPRSCDAPVYVRVRSRGASWTLTLRAACCSALPRGAYIAAAALTPLHDGAPMTPAFIHFRLR
jgi:hypothetical protein